MIPVIWKSYFIFKFIEYTKTQINYEIIFMKPINNTTEN